MIIAYIYFIWIFFTVIQAIVAGGEVYAIVIRIVKTKCIGGVAEVLKHPPISLFLINTIMCLYLVYTVSTYDNRVCSKANYKPKKRCISLSQNIIMILVIYAGYIFLAINISQNANVFSVITCIFAILLSGCIEDFFREDICNRQWYRLLGEKYSGLWCKKMMVELKKYGITAERKSIYSDLKDLEQMGIEVQGEKTGKYYQYHVVNRPFELAELKLLVDAIQSSKFITERKSNALIKKIEKMVSKYEAMTLQRQVYVSGRIKTMNESIYYTVDAIHNAISENRKIKFQYFQWTEKKEMKLRHGGKYYHISPWGLSWEGQNYYLVGYDSEAEKIKHYRVDKMLHIQVSEEKREGEQHFQQLDMADYAKKSFGLYGGKEQLVKLKIRDTLVGVMIDRFGKDVMIIPEDKGHFIVPVCVYVSRQFLGWVFSLGDSIEILSPPQVVEQMKEESERLFRQYH